LSTSNEESTLAATTAVASSTFAAGSKSGGIGIGGVWLNN
jgi:hypothetical protein